jgi:rhodanese-related sulfurtransferase
MNRALAAIAVLLGAMAVAAGNPSRSQAAARDPLARGEVTALQLAQWIKDRKTMRLLDVRTREEYDDFHLPRAEHVPLESLTTAIFESGDTVVMYSASLETTVRAVGVLESGDSAVVVLYMKDGISDWLTDILNPRRARDATPDVVAAFERKAELSRYFGGLPRITDDEPQTMTSTAAVLKKTKRRGCAF